MMTALYLLSLKEAERIPQAFCEAHFPRRMARAKRFVRREDALRCIGAGALLTAVLHLREEDLAESASGKPFSVHTDTHFNLSHSGNYVLLATDIEEIGADIERIDKAHLSLAGEVFQPDERQWMQEDPLERFFILWTLKESVTKQCGCGFRLPPTSFSVMPLIAGKSIQVAKTPVYARTAKCDDCIVAVCAQHPLSDLTWSTLCAEEIRNATANTNV